MLRPAGAETAAQDNPGAVELLRQLLADKDTRIEQLTRDNERLSLELQALQSAAAFAAEKGAAALPTSHRAAS